MYRRSFLKIFGVVSVGVAAGLSIVRTSSNANNEFAYQLNSYRGRGPKVCIKTSRAKFEQEYKQAVRSLKSNVQQIMNQEIRAGYLYNSGFRFENDPQPLRFHLIDGEWQRWEWA